MNKIKIWKQASNCSLEGWEKDEEVQISTEYNEFQILLHYICTIICFIVLSVPTFAKENSDNVIRVGSFEETYNTVNEKGERRGYGYEYLQDIAGYAGWSYEYITSNWEDCFTQLENGEIDILGGISYTDERAEKMLFSDMTMGEEKYYIYTDASNMDLTAGNLDSFEGKNIGVLKDHIPEDVLNEWELKYGSCIRSMSMLLIPQKLWTNCRNMKLTASFQ